MLLFDDTRAQVHGCSLTSTPM